MALIKHSRAKEITREAIVLDLGDLARQGDQLVRAARLKAQEIIRQAESERDRLVAGARERGHAEGLAAGRAEGLTQGREQGRTESLAQWESQIRAATEAWSAAADSFLRQRDSMLHEARTDVVRLAVQIAEKVTKRTIELDPGVAAAQIAEVLALIVRPTAVVVAISPRDRGAVETALPGVIARFSSIIHAELVDDPQLSPGSCIVRMRGEQAGAASPPGGEVDATIELQLDRIVRALLPDSAKGGDPDAPPTAESATP
ncbi:MAG: hypothetical protein KF745_02205 [Phycisphaeraceae bacterium]|nr:hypothetical protein [Phycisphaeraceae bacterium]